ncbi:MAG: hypothetical protein ORN27_08350 [Rhodoluna sp.]|nr:hypothetical protein [Rhodoluna sp.]
MQRVWSALTEIEKTESLASWQIAGINLWPILRMRIFRELTEQLGIFERRIEDREPANLVGPKKSEFGRFVVVPFVRKNDAGIDPYSLRISTALAQSVKTLEMSRVDELEAYFTKKYRKRALLAVAPKLKDADRQKWDRVMTFLETTLDAHLGRYRAFPRWALVQFYAQRHGWRKAFKKTKKVFIVNAWKRSMIAGAQAAGAWVVEPQHGLLTNSHPLLSWPGEASVAYLPNELYLWGSVWANNSMPASMKKTIVGYDKVLPAYAKVAKSILIVGQVHHTERMLEIAQTIASKKPDHAIVYKPHPQEDEALFADLKLPRNLMIGQKDRPAIELIANSEYVIGVYSMALIEAVAIGAKVISLRLPGSETLEAFADQITFASPTDKLDDVLAAAKPAASTEKLFATKLADSAFLELLEG